MGQELWKDIKNFEGLYQVSNFGRIRSLDRYVNYRNGKLRFIKGNIKKLTLNSKGYLKVRLFKNGFAETREVQRYVAETFIFNEFGKEQVNHKNGIKTDNRVDNLEWATALENHLHSLNVLNKGKEIVLKFDRNGKYLETYYSVKEAAEKNGIKSCSISNCINGKRKSAGGYEWAIS